MSTLKSLLMNNYDTKEIKYRWLNFKYQNKKLLLTRSNFFISQFGNLYVRTGSRYYDENYSASPSSTMETLDNTPFTAQFYRFQMYIQKISLGLDFSRKMWEVV